MGTIPQGDIITQQFVVNAPAELLNFLIEKKIRKSKNAIQSVLRRRLITVNGKLVTQYNHPLQKGDRVAVMKTDQLKKIKRLKGMSIVYEDDYLIVIEKESGLLSVPTEKEKVETAHGILMGYMKKKSKDGKVFVLHRLDREASGLMIFAKDKNIQGEIQRLWDFYVPVYNFVALVEGQMPDNKGQIRSWLTQNKNYHVFSCSFDNGGQEAVTDYKVIQSNGRYSLVSFNQLTKRRNQIRAQLQDLKCPIVGDRKYGASSSPIKRMAFHVDQIKIKHPVTKKTMEFKSAIPKTIMSLLNKKEN